jgi:hypothetical protein
MEKLKKDKSTVTRIAHCTALSIAQVSFAGWSMGFGRHLLEIWRKPKFMGAHIA